MKTILLPILLGLLLFCSGCNSKDTKLTIQGVVFDPNLQEYVADAHITLYTKQMVNGTWSNAYTKKDETYSGSDGRFLFDFEFQYTTGYKLSITKDKYFSISHEFTETEFQSDKFYEKEYEFKPKGVLVLHLKNNFSFDENDKIRYHIVGWETTCDDCCSNSYSELVGSSIDEEIVCSLEGAKDYAIEYIITRNNNTQANTKLFRAEAFENNLVEIIY